MKCLVFGKRRELKIYSIDTLTQIEVLQNGGGARQTAPFEAVCLSWFANCLLFWKHCVIAKRADPEWKMRKAWMMFKCLIVHFSWHTLHAFLFIRILFIRASASDLAKKQKHLKKMLSFRFEEKNIIFWKTSKIEWKSLKRLILFFNLARSFILLTF